MLRYLFQRPNRPETPHHRAPSLFRKLVCEPLEDRRLLAVNSPQVELFGLSPALFVENQGQWADSSIRFMAHGELLLAMLDELTTNQNRKRLLLSSN